MSHVQNDSKHLSPRQIINRYRKGEYVDESIDAISSAISSCRQSFDCNAVPFPTSIIEKVYEYIPLAKCMYERQKKRKGIEDIYVPDYPQLKEILRDLSYPDLWESMQEGVSDIAFIDVLRERRVRGKYILDVEQTSQSKVISIVSHLYRQTIEDLGLSAIKFQLCVGMMVK